MRNSLRKILLHFPGFEAVCRLVTRRHVRALMYHRFRDDVQASPQRVLREVLVQQARYLARHHTPWTPDDHLAAISGGRWPGGRCPVVITIDDGYADYANVAHPVFRDHGLPAMLFVVTAFVEGVDWLWWDKLEYCLATTKCTQIQTDDGQVFDLTTNSGREQAWHAVADRCRFVTEEEKCDLIARTAGDLGVELPVEAPADFVAVTWDQVKCMAEEGALFGAHTVSHPILSRVALGDADEEIRVSKEHLERRLGQPVHWFAYPQGGPADWTIPVRDLVSHYFRGSYLASPSIERNQHAYSMPRYCISSDMIEFRWKLCGAEFLGLRLRAFLGLSLDAGPSYWAGSTPTDPAKPKQARSSS